MLAVGSVTVVTSRTEGGQQRKKTNKPKLQALPCFNFALFQTELYRRSAAGRTERLEGRKERRREGRVPVGFFFCLF